MSKSIGIDLGTTNSVASIKKVHVEIIQNEEGDFITPSCVTLQKKKSKFLPTRKKSKFVVGKNALEWMKQDPQNTITAIKRLMGRSLGDPEVREIIEAGRKQYQIQAYSKGTENSLAVVLFDREYTPEEISAKILEKIKTDAEKILAVRLPTPLSRFRPTLKISKSMPPERPRLWPA